ncbi:glycosyltransferase family protein [Candidatus Giovannonibacteria bacterium]|nr:glycosyltransferase family protein [Candidatus Giovannonibacteria bacterium]
MKKGGQKLKVLAVIQTRMTSTRLPGKALADISGKPNTQWIIERLRAARGLDGVILGITDQKADDPLEELAQKTNIPVFRGRNEELVEMYHKIAKKFEADAILRVTGDCPLADPDLADDLIKVFRKAPGKYDYLTNVFPATWPDGLDLHLYPRRSLEYLYKNMDAIRHRYTLDLNFMESPGKFKIYNLASSQNLSALRWTLDWPEDLEFIRKVYDYFYPQTKRRGGIFKTRDILELLQKRPELQKINEKYMEHSAGYWERLLEDSKK